LRRYFAFVFTAPRNLSSTQKFELFLTMLARDHNVAAATQNSAFNAILFFYKQVEHIELGNVDALRAVRPQRVRSAPSVSDTHRLLDAVPDVGGYPTNFIARLMYGRGLRLGEAISLRVKDFNFESREITLRAAKGNKDRVVRLDDWMIVLIKRFMVAALTVLERDSRVQIPLSPPLDFKGVFSSLCVFCASKSDFSFHFLNSGGGL
jgi:integrase